jgi:1-acyl-sn-glycerol-3-phosphate acyltransferase
VRRFDTVRFGARAACLLLLIVGGIAFAGVLLFVLGRHWHCKRSGKRIMQGWMRLTARVLGLRIRRHGAPLTDPALLVANHVSWLDIIAIGSLVPSAFMAKDDVSRWPLIGRLAGFSGTLFIRRQSVSSLRAAIDKLAEILSLHRHVTLFPEGTSTDGQQVLPFHSGLFKAAEDAQVPVQALAIRYTREQRPDTLAPFIGEMTFLPHLLDILRARRTEVDVHFCPPLSPQLPVKRLAQEAWRQITEQLARG